MNDFDRMISESLRETARKYEPSDATAAQRKFLQRRRRRRGLAYAGGAVATAAVVVAVAVFPRPELVREGDVDVASGLRVAATIEVGDSPTAVAASEDAVWVANSGDGTVSRIDPATNEVVATIDVGDSPDEVAIAGDDIYVARQDGSVTWIDAGSNNIVERFQVVEGDGPAHLDIAGHEEALLVAHQETGNTWIVNERGVVARGGDLRATDVASYRGNWPTAYDGGSGELSLIRDVDQGQIAYLPVQGAPASENADLAVGLGAIWISRADGRLVRFDAQGDFLKTNVDIGGRHSDLAADHESLWAVTAQGDEIALLHRLDVDTGEMVEEPLQLEGEPVDVAVSGPDVWVANQAADTVTRVTVGGMPEPAPTQEPTPDVAETPGEGAQLFFAFEANGDIYLEYEDGTTVQLTMTPDIERNPAFGAVSLFFERHDHESDWFGIIEHNFVTGEERIVAERGHDPAASASGDLAYFDSTFGGERLNIARMGSNGELSLPAESTHLNGIGTTELRDFRALEWSDDGRTLYFQGLGEGWVTVQLPVSGDLAQAQPFTLNGANDQPLGATFVQPDNASEQGVEVASICCREVEGDAYSSASIGRILFTEGGPTYEEIVPDVLDFEDLDPADVYLMDAHELVYTDDGSWDMFSGTRSWILHQGGHVWLVDADGETLMLAGKESGPPLLGVPVNSDFGGFDLSPNVEGDLPD